MKKTNKQRSLQCDRCGNYFDVDKEETAIKLSESLNKKDNCNSWCWSDSKSWEE